MKRAGSDANRAFDLARAISVLVTEKLNRRSTVDEILDVIVVQKPVRRVVAHERVGHAVGPWHRCLNTAKNELVKCVVVFRARDDRGVDAAQSKSGTVVEREIFLPIKLVVRGWAAEAEGEVVVFRQWREERVPLGVVDQVISQAGVDLGNRKRRPSAKARLEATDYGAGPYHRPVYIMVSRYDPDMPGISPEFRGKIAQPVDSGRILLRPPSECNVTAQQDTRRRTDTSEKAVQVASKFVPQVGVKVVPTPKRIPSDMQIR
jgi:hypothetical protein